MKVGDIVFAETRGNAARYGTKIIKCKVRKVGSKYFYLLYCDSGKDVLCKFGIESMIEESDYTSNYKIYLSEKEVYDKNERPIIMQKIIDELKTFSVDSLKKILETIKE